MKKIILASQSPRRKQLLEWADVDFDVFVSNTDETFPTGLGFAESAMHIALEKGRAVQRAGHISHIIIAADTIVVCEGSIIGKPTDRQDAINILQKLSGKTHSVITGVSILDGENAINFYDETEVSFYPLTEAALVYYVDKYKPFDKAGAYAIQEWIGVVGIEEIKGDFYNVMGLPVSRVLKHLEALL